MDGTIMDREKLGRALLQAKKMTKDDLKSAFDMHTKIGGDFARLLVKMGYISDTDLTSTIAQLEGVQTIDVASMIIPENLIRSFPRDVIEKHNVIPIQKKDGVITLAMADTNDFAAIEEVQFLIGCRVEPVLASNEAIRKTVVRFYNHDQDGILAVSEGKNELSVKRLLNSEGADFRLLEKATIMLLLEKNVISESELLSKVKELQKKK